MIKATLDACMYDPCWNGCKNLRQCYLSEEGTEGVSHMRLGVGEVDTFPIDDETKVTSTSLF
jgi:hypothetical protein